MAVNLTALQVMQDAPVIPVIVLHDVAHAVPLARALVAGGIRMLEVTLRTPVALACIEAMARDVPEAIVGAGTVRSAADAQATVLAGARFAVSPGYTHAVGKACHDLGLAGWLSWKYHQPAELRSLRMAASLYVFSGLAMTAGGVAVDRLMLNKPASTTGTGDAAEARRVEVAPI